MFLFPSKNQTKSFSGSKQVQNQERIFEIQIRKGFRSSLDEIRTWLFASENF
jgi:hypothetical protein